MGIRKRSKNSATVATTVENEDEHEECGEVGRQKSRGALLKHGPSFFFNGKGS